MPLRVPCRRCATECTVPDSFAGRVIPCPRCGAPIGVGVEPAEAPRPPTPLLDVLEEELQAGAVAPVVLEPQAGYALRGRGKLRLETRLALTVAGMGALAFFILMLALFPRFGVGLSWLVVAAGLVALFAAVCWFLYNAVFAPPYRRRFAGALLGMLGALGCAGIGAIGAWYTMREVDRRDHPWKYAPKYTPAVARADSSRPSGPPAEKPGAKPAPPSSASGPPPGLTPATAAAQPPNPADLPPAEDLVSFNPADFGKPARGAKVIQGAPPADIELNPIEAALEEASRTYLAQVVADLLAGDDAVFREQMQWYPLGNRPVFGVRWACGVERGDLAPLSDALEKDLKALSLALVTGLDQRLANRVFGAWPETGDPRCRQVAVLRTGRRHELIAAAKRRAVDLLVIVQPVPEAGSAPPPPQNPPLQALKIDLFDVIEERVAGTFPAPLVPAAAGPAGFVPPPSAAVPKVPATELAEQFLKFVDERCALQPVPWAIVDRAKPRMTQLASRVVSPHASAAVLLEVRYYQVRQLVPNDQAIAVYDAILGNGNGSKLALGDPAARREVLQAWVRGQ